MKYIDQERVYIYVFTNLSITLKYEFWWLCNNKLGAGILVANIILF